MVTNSIEEILKEKLFPNLHSLASRLQNLHNSLLQQLLNLALSKVAHGNQTRFKSIESLIADYQKEVLISLTLYMMKVRAIIKHLLLLLSSQLVKL